MSADDMDAPPVIVYVDENPDARADFYFDAKNTGLFKDVIVLEPLPDVEQMMRALLEHNFEALISDFRLADAVPVNYDGSQLVERFVALRSGFPCFIRTSYDEEAVHKADDVNRVYSKDSKGTDTLHRTFFERVNLQVLRQRKVLSEWSEELEGLLDIGGREVSAPMIDRVLELDAQIEAYIGRDCMTSVSSKRALFDEEAQRRQQELLAETERLVMDVRKLLGE